jgi:hypothetical protein
MDLDKRDKKTKDRTRDNGQRSTVLKILREGLQSPTKALISSKGQLRAMYSTMHNVTLQSPT